MSVAPNARPTPDDRIRAALWFAEHGFGVFSVWSTTEEGTCRCPLGSACTSPGKHPVTPNGFHDATRDPARIRTLLSAGSQPNYGLVPPDGVFAWDVDTDDERRRLETLATAHGELPPTLRTATANGQHVFLRWPEDHPRPLRKMFGYVTRWGSGAQAGYVIGPRSVHASGAVYTPVPGALEIATLPDEWAAAALSGEREAPIVVGDPLPEVGGRHDWLRDRARHYAGVVREPDLLKLLLMAENARLPVPKAEAEVVRAIGDVLKKFGPDPKQATVDSLASRIDGAELIALTLPPLEWVVPDLLPEGTAILAAPPKVGKSCLVYQIAVETALGGELFGRSVKQGSVLYLALEDGKRRGKARLLEALNGRELPPAHLTVQWSSNRIGQGLEEEIDGWLADHPDARLVAIDTLQKVRPRSTGKQGAYEVDVEDLGHLQSLFRDRSIGLLVVHHTRKQAEDDFLSAVSGTFGITGSADTTLVIRRKRLEVFGTLVVTGRDIAETELSVQFNGLTWTEAPGGMAEASFQRQEIYKVIQERGPIFPKAIADILGVERSSIQHIVTRMADSGAITRTTDGYRVTGVTLNTRSERDSETDDDEISLYPPSLSSLTSPVTDAHVASLQSLSSPGSDSDVSDRGHARAPAREGWVHPCRSYREHQHSHRRTPDGWVCSICEADA